ncbi:hypothetical protein [Actinacidiphila sp. ITFR-21]|uniref:hypothetical protein n=1 Tax=Actinacidiphila sp. ITFR-21 TaxID=3075199 RepID=UPI00288BF565|nr:hypothetical protein [Streptomyces sp. ITFR-21]WNI19210.1 hypothetical protein RLT57_29145 [Streptomyces sp. ITFR-21]
MTTTDPPTTRLVCANCGLEVEDRGQPVAREGEGFGWYSNWVHANGGYATCFPQRGASSPKAKPVTP